MRTKQFPFIRKKPPDKVCWCY